jgi:hypothetical protein
MFLLWMMKNNTVIALRNVCYKISGSFNELHLQELIILKHYTVSDKQLRNYYLEVLPMTISYKNYNYDL